VAGAVRFRIVLFDLDGTLIDSGPIILASMQHAVRTVLGREIPPDELALTIGG
jgi:pyrophosphatase PpaX